MQFQLLRQQRLFPHLWRLFRSTTILLRRLHLRRHPLSIRRRVQSLGVGIVIETAEGVEMMRK